MDKHTTVHVLCNSCFMKLGMPPSYSYHTSTICTCAYLHTKYTRLTKNGHFETIKNKAFRRIKSSAHYFVFVINTQYGKRSIFRPIAKNSIFSPRAWNWMLTSSSSFPWTVYDQNTYLNPVPIRIAIYAPLSFVLCPLTFV